MKDRKKRDLVSGNRFFWCTLSLLLLSAFFSTFGLSTFRIFGVSFRPVLLPNGRNPEINAVSNEHNASLEYSVRRQIFRHGPVQIQEAVVFPDQVVVFLKRSRSQSTEQEQEQDIRCFYYARNSMEPGLELSPISINGRDPLLQIVRCPPRPRGGLSRVSLWRDQPPVPLSRKWYSLAYESLIDIDNTTVVFVKGLNLRREKLTDASRFECVYGQDFKRGKFLRSTAVSVAQEVVRCPTPDVLLKQPDVLTAMRVSVNFKGRGILNSVARPEFLPAADVSGSGAVKAHEMCVCTMVRNQARFLREWVMYHGRIGVDRWFIYDNNSDDEIEPVLDTLAGSGFNATRHDWPWIKTQEAGFAHCAVRARHVCEWVGFIDVDEFLHLPSNHTLHDVLRNHSDPSVGELRTACLNFGPSGLKRAPPEGVIAGYTCRMAAPERHKSIIRPEALNATLVNVVHHFHLREGFSYVNLERGTMVINHYKYQVWEVFKEKFYRRVATYVSDWKEKENAGSKDRAPGLGTRPIEPPNWSTRFCEVTDNGLKKWALKEFRDPETQLLPWTI